MDLYTAKVFMEEFRVIRQQIINLNLQVSSLCYSLQQTNHNLIEHLNELNSAMEECTSIMLKNLKHKSSNTKQGRYVKLYEQGRPERNIHEVVIDFYRP